MSDPYVEKVLRLAAVANPVERPTESEWKALENESAIALPNDFKELVSALGSGAFGEFSLLNPSSSSKYTRLSRERLLLYSNNLKPIAREGGFSLYPEPGGLIRIGAGANRMDLLLEIAPAMPVGYRLVWLDQDDRLPHRLNLTVGQFLHDLYLELISEPWTKDLKNLIWGPGELFFVSRPGRGEAPDDYLAR